MAFQIFEPDVTFTDYGLVILSVLLAVLLYRTNSKNKELKMFSILFFLSLAFASFFGGTAHGFFPDTNAFVHIALWKLTLTSLGLAALFSWVIAGNITFPKYKSVIFYLASLEFLVYVLYIIFINSEFKIAIYNYIPPTIFLLISLIEVYTRQKDKLIGLGIVGILLTFIAAWIQQAQISIHSIYFNYNALYHLIQAGALILIFFAFRFITSHKKVRK